MGNSNAREARSSGAQASSNRHGASYLPDIATLGVQRSDRPSPRTRNRVSRADLGLFGLGASGTPTSNQDAPFERRETRTEREARRLERERAVREKERERSMREEHVDGGYLVTLGTYTGTEDFSKPTVRQLQIERKIAPFWRGLNDFSDNWTEGQLLAAGRGLPIPPADTTPPPDLIPRAQSPDSPSSSTPNINNLTVPLGPRSLSASSDRSTSNIGSALPSPSSPSPRTSSPFKPRAKALAAALSVGSRNASQNDLSSRETSLPHDPFINGLPLEVFMYRNAAECPICFLYYPPYLNYTRCCSQPICSECFVQIKRPDPHLPEHHGDSASSPAQEEPPDMLISEPATCPYCQQPEFGVTYEPPPFRRGMTYFEPLSIFGSTAMSSRSSLNSTISPSPRTPPSGGARRRTQSLSATSTNVITTDRIRPDWATKLAAQRAHQARRAAAATALHTAAFLMGGSDSRSFAFARPGRFSRRNTGASGSGTSSQPGNDAQAGADCANDSAALGPEPGPRSSSGRPNASGLLASRRSRLEELEDMMLMEAMRLSLASEEERRRKAEKEAEREAKKEAKRKEKEQRKAMKQQQRHGDIYGGVPSSSGSSLSLGLGRRRGNSGASNLRVEATVQGAMTTAPRSDESEVSAPNPVSQSPVDKGKGVDRGPTEGGNSSTQAIPIPSAPSQRGPSHLRQMSNASSISSSVVESTSGSYAGQGYLTGRADGLDPRGSAASLSRRSEDGERDPDSAGTEPMFNFRSLAEMVGVDLEGGLEPADQGEQSQVPASTEAPTSSETTQIADTDTSIDQSIATLNPTQAEDPQSTTEKVSTPEFTFTPDTPAPLADESCKILGHEVVDRPREISQ